MGTNFYWLQDKNDNRYSVELSVHIGKRSAAGTYCFDCGTTLCKEGVHGIHHHNKEWYETCPHCGGSYAEDMQDSSMFVELGFSDGKKEQVGVGTTCSFTWTIKKHLKTILKLIDENNTSTLIVDEYGKEYTAKEFYENILAYCMIEFQLPCEFD